MKLSDLITSLQAELERHGDLEVRQGLNNLTDRSFECFDFNVTIESAREDRPSFDFFTGSSKPVEKKFVIFG